MSDFQWDVLPIYIIRDIEKYHQKGKDLYKSIDLKTKNHGFHDHIAKLLEQLGKAQEKKKWWWSK